MPFIKETPAESVAGPTGNSVTSAYGLRLSGGRPGFTLAEMLVSMAVSALVMSMLLSALVSAARYSEHLADYRKAIARIAAVEAFLRQPAAYCGLGVPLEPEQYKAAFWNMPHEPFNWEGPVSAGTASARLTGTFDRRRDNALFIAYAMWSDCRASRRVTLDGEKVTMRLDRAPRAGKVERISRSQPSCKSFVCFGSSIPTRTPLCVERIDPSSLLLSNAHGRDVTVQRDDKMWLFRAMTVFAYNDNLYSYDFSGSGRQPRLSGICDLRFRVDTEAKKLTVYIMARGDKKYNERQRGRRLVEWPEEYRSDMFANKENYLLVTERIVLELPNCRHAEIPGMENAAEAF